MGLTSLWTEAQWCFKVKYMQESVILSTMMEATEYTVGSQPNSPKLYIARFSRIANLALPRIASAYVFNRKTLFAFPSHSITCSTSSVHVRHFGRAKEYLMTFRNSIAAYRPYWFFPLVAPAISVFFLLLGALRVR